MGGRYFAGVRRLRGTDCQSLHPQEVVSGGGHRHQPAEFSGAVEHRATHGTDGLCPAEELLDAFTDSLASILSG